MKKLKYFDREKYRHEVHVLETKVKAYNEFLKIADRLFKGSKSMEDLVKSVNASTGFLNPRMSADALNILDEFNRCIQLEAVWSGINHSALELVGNEYKIKEEHLQELEEIYKVYYPEDQAKQIKSIEKAVEILNALDMPFRASLQYNPVKQFWMWAKQHTDNNIAVRGR